MQNFDVVVIGAGPGGYVAAIRAAQLGFKTAVIEREYLGGVCLNVGCIPSKAMITAAHHWHSAQHLFPNMGFKIKVLDLDYKKLLEWKNSVANKMSSGVSQLLKGNQVTVIKGQAQFKSAQELTVGSETVRAKYFVIATGSRPIEIPGFKFDEKDILSSTGALALDHAPRRVVTIGGGYIGLEISSYLRKFGSEVTVVEAQSSLLSGVVDPECAQVVVRKLEKSGVKILTNAKAKGQKKTSDGYEVTIEVNGQEQVLKADKVLVTVGRRPNGDQMNLNAAGVQVDARGFIKVDAQRRTQAPHIFAIGDIAGQPMLAHKASHEGVLVAEVIKGHNRVYDAKTVPAVVFTDPEIASAGLMESEARAKGYKDLLISKFPFAANGRAVSMQETEGFVKMIADPKTHILLGVHIVGPDASNLISEAALAIEMGARLEDLALTIHPHPTLGETMMESAEATLGHAIHIIQKPLTNGKNVHV
ncbi:MAG: dihydrolipoyl dehydrogenase [Bdellovibrionales bacterium]